MARPRDPLQKIPLTLRYTPALVRALEAELTLARRGGTFRSVSIGQVAETLIWEALRARGRGIPEEIKE